MEKRAAIDNCPQRLSLAKSTGPLPKAAKMLWLIEWLSVRKGGGKERKRGGQKKRGNKLVPIENAQRKIGSVERKDKVSNWLT